MKVLPTFLLLGTSWTCQALDSLSDLSEWPQNYHRAEEGASSYTSHSHDQIPEHESLDFSGWQKIWDSADDGTANWQQHLGPVSTLPSDSQPNIPISGSLREPAQSFGLPILWLTKKFFKKTGALIEHHSTFRAGPKPPLGSLEVGQAMVVNDDAEFWKFCGSFRSIVKGGSSGLSERTRYFINNRHIWIKFWERQTGINLQKYVDQITFEPMKQTFPLFLFHIEVITMVLPKMKMEGLHARCDWYVQLANAMYKPQNPDKDPTMHALVQSLSRRRTEAFRSLAGLTKTFVSAWANRYRPRIFATEKARSRDEFKLPLTIGIFLNTIFTSSIVQFTHECQRLLSQQQPPHL
ncbi:hypothetical protein PCANC_25209 [Puccinia coronata f. sp. avenae]|uniref:Uncharacterized protein n=1 Tax=Puccinia coronata f. sp. avenae TaxID=200324 RepID=A0A2N5TXL5_9BASI|nr:hypothetical protein PCANC_25209 [Puccinia coronata f. sp. avenae]